MSKPTGLRVETFPIPRGSRIYKASVHLPDGRRIDVFEDGTITAASASMAEYDVPGTTVRSSLRILNPKKENSAA